MNVVELIKTLRDTQLLDHLYQEQGVSIDSEALLIYLKDSIDLGSEICIFEAEETEDELFFEKDGVRYIQLFAVDHTIDLIEYDLDLNNKGYSDTQIAQRLLEYRRNDA